MSQALHSMLIVYPDKEGQFVRPPYRKSFLIKAVTVMDKKVPVVICPKGCPPEQGMKDWNAKEPLPASAVIWVNSPDEPARLKFMRG